MTSEQEATITVVQSDIRGALRFLALPCMIGMEERREIQAHLESARDFADSLILEHGTPSSKKETTDEMVLDIAAKDVELFEEIVKSFMDWRIAIGRPLSEENVRERVRRSEDDS
jgi:hypothetical protein